MIILAVGLGRGKYALSNYVSQRLYPFAYVRAHVCMCVLIFLANAFLIETSLLIIPAFLLLLYCPYNTDAGGERNVAVAVLYFQNKCKSLRQCTRPLPCTAVLARVLSMFVVFGCMQHARHFRNCVSCFLQLSFYSTHNNTAKSTWAQRISAETGRTLPPAALIPALFSDC